MSTLIRDGSIYLPKPLLKMYTYLGHACGKPKEEVVQAVLEGWIKANHPSIVEFVELGAQREEEFVSRLKGDAKAPKVEGQQ